MTTAKKPGTSKAERAPVAALGFALPVVSVGQWSLVRFDGQRGTVS